MAGHGTDMYAPYVCGFNYTQKKKGMKKDALRSAFGIAGYSTI